MASMFLLMTTKRHDDEKTEVILDFKNLYLIYIK